MHRSLHRLLAALLAVTAFATAPLTVARDLPETTRQVEIRRIDDHWRWVATEAPIRRPGPGQVLVRMHAVSLNRHDLEILEMSAERPFEGRIALSDGAGEIVALGAGVEDFAVGDRVTSLYLRNWVDGPLSEAAQRDVLGITTDGVFGDYVVLDATSVAHMPATLDFVQAATLPTAGLTGYMATVGSSPLAAGAVVVVQGTGGVSTAALQFARAVGARVVVTSSADAKLETARALGAAHGINYRSTPEWADAVRAWSGGRGADLVVDVGGKATLGQSARSLAWRGTIALVGGLTGYDGELPTLPLLMRSGTARGIYVGSRVDYARMAAFVAEHRLQPVVDRVHDFEARDAALAQFEAGEFVGKVVIRLAPPAAPRAVP